jgi:hypothetical protein
VKRLITLAALAAVCATPLAALADDTTPNVATSAPATLLVVDQSGHVLGKLVPVASLTNAIRETAERSQTLLNAPAASAPDTRWHPRQPETPEFWEQFNQRFTSTN